MENQAIQNQVLLNFLQHGRFCNYRKNEIILRAADTPQGVYYLHSGHVKEYTLTEQGEENIHIIYKPGEMLPLIWAIKGVIRNVFYETIDNVQAWLIPRQSLMHLAGSDQAITNALLLQAINQLHIYADRVDNLEYTTAYERIVYRILFLGGRFGQRRNNKIVIDAPITHHHIARSVNLARETASREIEKLEHKGLIEFSDHKITINDPENLQKEIGEPISLDIWGLK